MTAEEIRNSKNESDDGAWESAKWLREIAAQLAEANEDRRARLAEAAGKADFLELLTTEITPLIPKLKEFCEQAFAPPVSYHYPGEPVRGAEQAFAPPVYYPGEPDGVLFAYLKSRGHDLDKSAQIIANHREAVIAEMNLSASLAMVPADSDPTAAPAEPGAGE